MGDTTLAPPRALALATNLTSPLLPPAAMSRRAAAGAGRGTEIVGFAGRSRLIDLAFAISPNVVGRGFARGRAAGTVGQRFRAVHFVEVGLVDAGGATTPGPPIPTPQPTFPPPA